MKKTSNAPRVISRGKPPKAATQKTTFQKELDKWPSAIQERKKKQ